MFPIVLMVLLVSSFGTEPDPDFGGVGGTDFYVPVHGAATIAAMGLLGIPTHLAGYRQTGVMRRLRAAGVPPRVVMATQLAVMVVLVGVGLGAMFTIGFAGFGLSSPASPGGVALGLLAGTLAFAGIGVALGSLVPTPRGAQGLGLLLFFGLFFIAGGGPPPALLPDAINRAVDLTPMGPLVDVVSEPWHGHGIDLAAAVALLAIGAVTAVVALRRLGEGRQWSVRVPLSEPGVSRRTRDPREPWGPGPRVRAGERGALPRTAERPCRAGR